MAFNFNWSPLTADADFYRRARELLTKALNKSPKPPIIVDDILVSELNLGTVPPDLEILEIGDLAEDRFHGIFKMCYSGDAYLTLKTRVQVRWTPIAPYPLSEHCSNFRLELRVCPMVGLPAIAPRRIHEPDDIQCPRQGRTSSTNILLDPLDLSTRCTTSACLASTVA